MAEVVLERLCKQYAAGGPFAVRDLDVRIADGEFVVIVGPSGCGKSTTLRLIAGLETPTSGAIHVGGVNVTKVPPRDRDVAMVFQDYALYPHMTVRENLAFGLRMRSTAKEDIERRVLETAAMLGMSDLLQRRPGTLSGGQRQRVAVGKAIARVPGARCVLFDEPLSNLDPALRAVMRAEIKSLHQRLRMTAIYVTHDQEEAMTLGQRVVVLANGVGQQVGPPLEVYRSPRNRFVAGFIGSPAMNFISGQVIEEAGELRFMEDGAHGLTIALAGVAAVVHPGRIVLGIRPEHISFSHASHAHGLESRATIRLIEPLGDQANVHVTTPAGTRLVARSRSHEISEVGREVDISLATARAHLFAPGEFGEALTINRT
jgi:multiple sugar transport system ATP-binding protein